jgi:hypothetical protein
MDRLAVDDELREAPVELLELFIQDGATHDKQGAQAWQALCQHCKVLLPDQAPVYITASDILCQPSLAC